MSRLKLGKKVWKSFSNTLIAAFHSLHHLVPSKRRCCRRRSLANTASASNYHVESDAKKNMFAICIDDLICEPASSSSSMHVGHAQEDGISIDTIEDAWKIVIANTPELQVDERAEEFISKFRQQLRLQNESSLVDERAGEFISKFRQQLRLQNESSLVDEKAEEFISKFRQQLRSQKELEFKEMLN